MLRILLAVAIVGQSALTLKVAPGAVTTLDLGKLKGHFVCQLAWAPDAVQFYVQTCDEDRAALLKASYHYIVPLAGGIPRRVDAQPDWAAAYWTWKSAQTAPRDPAFKIDVSASTEVRSATAHPMAGDLALGGSNPGRSGVPAQVAANAARDSETVNVYRMTLKGQIVGEWINHRTMPGTTFGWGPVESGLIAYADPESGALLIMDKSGSKQKVEDTKNILLPAWTADGAWLAYLENLGHDKYALIVAKINGK